MICGTNVFIVTVLASGCLVAAALNVKADRDVRSRSFLLTDDEQAEVRGGACYQPGTANCPWNPNPLLQCACPNGQNCTGSGQWVASENPNTYPQAVVANMQAANKQVNEPWNCWTEYSCNVGCVPGPGGARICDKLTNAIGWQNQTDTSTVYGTCDS